MKYAYKTIDTEGNLVCYQGDNPPADYHYVYDSPLPARAKIVDGKVIEYVAPEPPAPYVPTPEEIKKQKYAQINTEYSQKIAGIGNSGVLVAKQDALVAGIKTQWKAALLEVSKS